ncbi:MAG: hypothetical protein PUD07_04025 [bacterium]|nr:hypothetical protein [bacterium]
MNSSNNFKEFLILTKYKEFINLLDDVIENILKKDIYYKTKLKETCINLLYYINKTNNEEDYNKRNSYKVEINENKTNIIDLKNEFNFLEYNFKLINNKTIINLTLNSKKI